MNPIKYEGSTAVFTSEQIELFGHPNLYGYYDILVLEVGKQYVMDYKLFHSQYEIKKIHHYNQDARFYTLCKHLLGGGKISKWKLQDIIYHVQKHKCKNWYDTKKVLKKLGLRIYYNRIPYILYKAQKIQITSSKSHYRLDEIMKHYEKIKQNFLYLKNFFKRSYFPNMRYIALKLFKMYQIPLAYEIPFALTKQKYQELEDIWNLLY